MDWQPRLPKEPETEHRQSKQCWQSGVLAGIAFVFLVSGTVTAVILTVAAAAVFLWYHHMAMHEFGGTTGDLAGYFLQTAELAMIAALAVCSRI